MKALLTAVLAAVLVALPRVAAACPACAGREGGGKAITFLIGGIILFPAAVAYVVYRVIKKGAQP